MDVPVPPAALKIISPYMKLAKEYDKRDEVVAYYCEIFLCFSQLNQIYISNSFKEGCPSASWFARTLLRMDKKPAQYGMLTLAYEHVRSAAIKEEGPKPFKLP